MAAPTTAAPGSGRDGLTQLQHCYERWAEIDGLVSAAAFVAGSQDIAADKVVETVSAILWPARRLADQLGDDFAKAIVALGGMA